MATSTLSSNFKITVAQTRKPNVFHSLKYLPNSIKYVGEQVEINGTPGGNIPKSASVLFFMSLWSFFVWSSSLKQENNDDYEQVMCL